MAVLAAAIVLAAPVSWSPALAVALAWLRGWPPRRLYRAAAWCLPMVAVWLAAVAAPASPWPRLAAAPYLAWLAMWHEAAAGGYRAAAVTIAPAAIPLGLVAGGLAWSWRIYSMETGQRRALSPAPRPPSTRGSGGTRCAPPGPGSPRPARCRCSPGDGASVVAGARSGRSGHRAAAAGDASRTSGCARTRWCIGTTGTGKTTLLLRLWAGFSTRGLQLHAAGARAAPAARRARLQGRRRLAADRRPGPPGAARRRRRGPPPIWPDEASLSLWDAAAAPARPRTLVDMIEHGTGGAAYYADVMEAIVGWRWRRPCGPPASAADFLARLDAGWLGLAYAGAPARRRAGAAPVGRPARQRHRAAVPHPVAAAGRRAGRAGRLR